MIFRIQRNHAGAGAAVFHQVQDAADEQADANEPEIKLNVQKQKCDSRYRGENDGKCRHACNGMQYAPVSFLFMK